jgi:hypothetical protein
MPQTKFDVGMTWYVQCHAVCLLLLLLVLSNSVLVVDHAKPTNFTSDLLVCVCFPPFGSVLVRISEGCASAVKRILGKIEGEESISPCGHRNVRLLPDVMDGSDFCRRPLVIFLFSSIVVGVHDIQTDVAAKSVIVEADATVSAELMLEKLVKVSLENPFPLICFFRRGDNMSFS